MSAGDHVAALAERFDTVYNNRKIVALPRMGRLVDDDMTKSGFYL